jgi:methionyl-tRNA synthetase
MNFAAKESSVKRTFYLTTAIDYVNARPHLGTAYEKIGADCLARYKRLDGFDTYFLMGTDEHSTNVEREARNLGKEPQAYTDEMAVVFERTWRSLHLSYDQFIRTTDPAHKRAVAALFQKIHDNGHIYEGKYSGLYCEGCEEFKAEKDLVDGNCPRHLTPAKYIEEKNYFFALSKFGEKLKQHITINQDFVRPDIRRNEILNVIESGLEDVSVSRSGKTWGVPLPIAPDQVVYVWFDALINYISAIGYAEPADSAAAEKFKTYWPADVHIIGKDITRFHCLIWPAMLMAGGVELPRSVFGHGFVYNRGEKMSKTIGNIVDPIDLAGFFGADALRYLLLREIAFDRDGDFTVELFVARYNAELANELGNLFSRTLAMTHKFFGGEVPEWSEAASKDTARLLENVVPDYRRHMDRLAFDQGLAAVWRSVQDANRFIEERKPWALAKAGDRDTLSSTMRALLEVLRVASVLCQPFMPEKAVEMRALLRLDPDFAGINLDEAERPGDTAWKTIGEASVLFPRLEVPA